MNLLELVVSIGIKMDELDRGLNEASKKANGFGEKLKSGLSTVGKVAGKAALTGVTAAATAVGFLTKQATDAFANYEQLVGGVETLFGKSADTIMDYANNAYKTAGLSANEYMETVTSFSASLLQSLGGNTQQAAQYADRAVTDMSDNANKMGTSMEMIQNAYQGFAKQNFTMLDNLKLGYGGTKEEMQRLLDDAEKLSGVKYDISSFASIVDAIHVVQEEMGITGTTAKEAATTIQGSLSSMKSAWQNLVTGIADENQNLDVLLDNLIDSVTTAGNNILPRLEQILRRIGEAVQKVAPVIVEQLPMVISTVLPPMLDAGTQLLMALVEGIVAALPGLTDAAVQIITTLAEGLIQMLPSLATGAVQIVAGLAEGIGQALPTLIPAAVEAILIFLEGLTSPESMNNLLTGAVELINGLILGLANAIPKLVEYAPEIIMNLVIGLIAAIPKILEAGTMLIAGLIEGIKQGIMAIPAAIVKIGESILKAFKEFFGIHSPSTVFAEMGGQLIAGLLQGISNTWKSIASFFQNAAKGLIDLLGNAWQTIQSAAAAAWNNITSVFKAAWNGIKSVWSGAASFFQGVWRGISGAFSGVASYFGSIFSSAWSAVRNAWGNVTGFFSSIASKIKNVFSSLPSSFSSIGRNMMDGLKSGISSAVSSVVSAAKNVASSAINAAKKVLKINSPSKAFEWLGGMSGEGLAEGIEGSIRRVDSAASSLADGLLGTWQRNMPNLQANMSAGFATSAARPAAAAASYGGTTINITVNGAQYSDERALAQRIAQEIQAISDRRNAYAPA